MSFGTNAPNGLQPIKKLDGSDWTSAINAYPIASGYNTNIFNGDPVAMLSDGTIGIGVAGASCRGVFQGVKYVQANGWVQFSPNWIAGTTVAAGTTVQALVLDDPNIVFSVQETNGAGGAGTPLTLADVGLNINFAIGSGIAAVGQSTTSINNTTEATTSTLNLKILGLDPNVENQIGAFANWLVTWNVHDLKSVGTAGV